MIVDSKPKQLFFLSLLASVLLHVFGLYFYFPFFSQDDEIKQGIQFQISQQASSLTKTKKHTRNQGVQSNMLSKTQDAESDIAQSQNKISSQEQNPNAQAVESVNQKNDAIVGNSNDESSGTIEIPPRLLSAPSIEKNHPDLKWAREQNISGTVVMLLSINTQGQVVLAQIHKSLHPRLDQLALRMVKEFRFTPAKKHDQPTDVKIYYRYQFEK